MEDYFKHRPHANVFQPTTTAKTVGIGETMTADTLKAAIKSMETAEAEGCEAMIKFLWGMGVKVMVSEFQPEPIAVLPIKYKEAFDNLIKENKDE